MPTIEELRSSEEDPRLTAVSTLAALTAVVGACSNAQEPATGSQAGETPSPSAQAAPTSGAATPSGSGITQINDIFGPACAQVPKEGPGSAQGMVNDPVATAASHNPLLTTLTKAVQAANLSDTLNSAPTLTVFAPADSAFQLEAQNPGILNQLTTAPDVASSNSKLAKILTYHVVGQRYDAAGLVQTATVDSLEGAKIKIGGTPAAPTVNGAQVQDRDFVPAFTSG
jgi:uncharacterized surface protein with fasciclin (FAS1) repeats